MLEMGRRIQMLPPKQKIGRFKQVWEQMQRIIRRFTTLRWRGKRCCVCGYRVGEGGIFLTNVRLWPTGHLGVRFLCQLHLMAVVNVSDFIRQERVSAGSF
jgi:hypothetical protein